MIIKNLSYLAVIAVFIVFSFFRFYNLERRIIFDWDQEQFSQQIKDIVKHRKFTLIGPRANSDQGFFLGPYLTYIILPFYIASRLDPGVLIPFLILFNISFFIISFFVLKRIYSTVHALWFLLFWAINPIFHYYDTTVRGPLFISLGVIFLIYVLYKIHNSPNNFLFWLLTGVIFGFFINMHFLFIMLFPLVLIFSFLIYKKKPFRLTNPLVLFLTFILMQGPLILFDLRHNFLNSKLLLQFNIATDVTQRGPFTWLPVFTNFIAPITLVKSDVTTIIFYLIFILILFLLIKKNKGFKLDLYKSFLGLWLLFPLVFSLYGRRPSEYFFLFLGPLIYIILIDFISSFKIKAVLFFLFFIVLVFNIDPLKRNIFDERTSMYRKRGVVQKLVRELEGKKFSLSFDGEANIDTGFRYLFELYRLTPQESGPHVRIRLPCRYENTCFGIYGIEIPPELKK